MSGPSMPSKPAMARMRVAFSEARYTAMLILMRSRAYVATSSAKIRDLASALRARRRQAYGPGRTARSEFKIEDPESGPAARESPTTTAHRGPEIGRGPPDKS